MRDLEIRGAGSLLGAEQRGNMSAVGFDLYAQMLHGGRGRGARRAGAWRYPEVRVDLPLAAFLPEEYVPAVDERVRFYRRLAGSPSIEASTRVAAELREAFGAPPEPARNLRRRRPHPGARGRGGRDERRASCGGGCTISPVELSTTSKRGRLAAAGRVYLERERKLRSSARLWRVL